MTTEIVVVYHECAREKELAAEPTQQTHTHTIIPQLIQRKGPRGSKRFQKSGNLIYLLAFDFGRVDYLTIPGKRVGRVSSVFLDNPTTS